MDVNVLMAVFLVPLYAIAAGLRIYAACRNRLVRFWYLASIPGALVTIGVYIAIAVTNGGNDTITTIARLSGFPSVVIVWIWPAVIAARGGK
jgi:hypothetical protein